MNSKNKKWLVLVLLLLVVGCGFFFYTKQSEDSNGLKKDQNAQAYKSKIKKPEDWAKEEIAFPSYNQINVEEGAKQAYVALLNPEFNDANMQFIVTMDDQKEPLLESGLVEPGQAITTIDLPQDLAVGEHTVHLHMKGYTTDEEPTELNGTRTNFTLMVLKKK
ncbi:hypothetical protein [Vagococcus xieshaowenii]|uniref:Lipoprotein n=1 Tax=Vagococcus xieshaowenii TaxID=2562451 RepID=A0AAJ5EDD9_9ENTE|nr:hypothetical protein [Vagococcus xieshaowenii]QCA27902.1 hypothetical protein E4Z98_00475 [Vagococcus xieshaowenii]TFZ39419.1 hypothetical protein E4031_08915 [Vagococcus xieshaowenii]